MEKNKIKLCIACSAGGHLTESLLIIDPFLNNNNYSFFFICDNYERTRKLAYKKYLFDVFEYNPIDYLLNLIRLTKIFIKEKPNYIISTGAQIGMISIIVAKLLGIRTIYIETITRIHKPSTTAKVVYFFSDIFLVQNQELLNKFGKKAQYKGGIL